MCRDCISVGGRVKETSLSASPAGRLSKAFCSEDFSRGVDELRVGFEGERLSCGFIGDPSFRFFGRPRSMMEPADS